MATCQFTFGDVLGGGRSGPTPAIIAATAVHEVKTLSGTSQQTTAVAASDGVCRIVADGACYVAFGSNPTAVAGSGGFWMPAGAIDYIRIAKGDKGAVIQA